VNLVTFGVLMAGSKKIAGFWNVALSRLVEDGCVLGCCSV
jgi:hypothetical protein